MTQADITISWEELCQRGRDARENADNAKWELGALACTISLNYGEHNLADFAREVNCGKRSIQQYRQVSERYSDPRFDELKQDPALSWTHFRIGLRFDADTAAYDFLDKTARELWTVDQASIEAAALLGKGKRMALVLDAADVHIVDIRGSVVIINLGASAQPLIEAFYGETPLQVKWYQEMSE